jgi:hypothetical protein
MFRHRLFLVHNPTTVPIAHSNMMIKRRANADFPSDKAILWGLLIFVVSALLAEVRTLSSAAVTVLACSSLNDQTGSSVHREFDQQSDSRRRFLRESWKSGNSEGISRDGDGSATPIFVNTHEYANTTDFFTRGGRCSTRKPTDAEWNENTRKRGEWHDRRRKRKGRRPDSDRDLQSSPNTTITVNLNFVVISNTSGAGNLPDATIQNQINVMNAAYAPEFRFQLLNTPNSTITRVSNNQWYLCTNRISEQFKLLYRRGGPETLNIYTCALSGLGFATMPFPSANSVNDGIVLAFNSFPGGSIRNYNQGDVRVTDSPVLTRYCRC